MARPGITYEDVSKTAAQLLEQGLHPSIQRVREALGTGSNSTISEHLQRWQQELRARPKLAILPQVPEPLTTALEMIWRTALEQAEAAYQAQRDQATQAVAAADQARDRALAQANQAGEDLATLQRHLEEIQATRRELENKLLLESERRQVAEAGIAATDRKIAAVNKANEQIRQEAQVTLAKLEMALEQAREDAKQQLAEAEQRLRHECERSEANEVRLLRLIEQTRSDHTAERLRLEAASQASHQREATLQEQLTGIRQEHELLRSTLAGTAESKRLLKLELEHVRQGQRELETLHLQAVRQAEYLRGELETGNRERQSLEQALQFCRQALEIFRCPPSPVLEQATVINSGNKPEL